MTDENKTNPTIEEPITNNQTTTETPVATSEVPTTSEPLVSPENTEPATSEVPTTETEQTPLSDATIAKSNANSEENALKEYELPIRITSNTLVSDLNFVKNKKVVGEATFDGIKFESGTDLSNFTDIKLENCDLSNLDVKLTPGCIVKIGDRCAFPKDESGQDIIPEGWMKVGDNTFTYVGKEGDPQPSQEQLEQELENLKLDRPWIEEIKNITEEKVIFDSRNIFENLQIINEKNLTLVGSVTFRDIGKDISQLDFTRFKGEITFENCDLSDLANFNFPHGQKIKIDNNCTLPDKLPAGWKREKNTLIYEKPRTYEKAEKNQKIVFDGNNIDDFKFFTKDLKENNTYTDAPIVIKNVKLKGEIDLRNLKNVRFENCDLSDAKILTADDGIETKITADADTKLPKKNKYKKLIEQDLEETKKEDKPKDKKTNDKKTDIREVNLGKADYDGFEAQAELMGVAYGVGPFVGSGSGLDEYAEKQTSKQGKRLAKVILKSAGNDSNILSNGTRIGIAMQYENWALKNPNSSRFIEGVYRTANKADKFLSGAAQKKYFQAVIKGEKWTKYPNASKIYKAADKFAQQINKFNGTNLAQNMGKILNNNVVNVAGKSFLKICSKAIPMYNICLGISGSVDSWQNGNEEIAVLKVVSTVLKFAGPVGAATAFIIDAGIMIYEGVKKYNEKENREKYFEELKNNNPEEYNYQMWKQSYLSGCVRSEDGGKKLNDADLKKLYEALSKLPPDKYEEYMKNQVQGEFDIKKELTRIKNLVEKNAKNNDGSVVKNGDGDGNSYHVSKEQARSTDDKKGGKSPEISTHASNNQTESNQTDKYRDISRSIARNPNSYEMHPSLKKVLDACNGDINLACACIELVLNRCDAYRIAYETDYDYAEAVFKSIVVNSASVIKNADGEIFVKMDTTRHTCTIMSGEVSGGKVIYSNGSSVLGNDINGIYSRNIERYIEKKYSKYFKDLTEADINNMCDAIWSGKNTYEKDVVRNGIAVKQNAKIVIPQSILKAAIEYAKKYDNPTITDFAYTNNGQADYFNTYVYAKESQKKFNERVDAHREQTEQGKSPQQIQFNYGASGNIGRG